MRLTALACCLSLAGCCTTQQLGTPVVPPPANLSSPCLPLEQLPSPATMGDLLRAGIDNADLYAECSQKQRGLVSAWPKAAGDDRNKP